MIVYTAKMKKRDEQILKFLERGWQHQRIADKMGLSVHRVRQIIYSRRAKPRRKAA